jgi:hypothetical protein
LKIKDVFLTFQTEGSLEDDIYEQSVSQAIFLIDIDPYYGMDLVGNGYAGCSGGSMMGNGVTAYRSATPLGLSHHALTEPNFKLRDNMGISGRNLTAPSLQRFAAHSRHSRSYDSGLGKMLTLYSIKDLPGNIISAK